MAGYHHKQTPLMKNSLIVFILLFSIFACSDKEPQPATGVNIRLKNTSIYDYTDVYINTNGGEFNYGNIKSNESTAYYEFQSAYSYAYVQLKVANNLYVIQPIDYFGEEHLEKGNYTYEIGANNNGGQYDRLTISLVGD
jgi:hypothetical protein